MTNVRDLAQSQKEQIENLMREAYIPGISIATVSSGQIESASLGITNAADSKSTVTPDTQFWACSLSKPVFAYLVIKLINSKQLGEDFNLETPLPWDESILGPQKDKKPFTAKMILSHMTGLPNEGPPDRDFKPGEDFRYSGEGYLYLQRFIEKQTRLQLEELAKKEIFNPIGMSHSSFLFPENKSLATNHDESMQPRAAESRNPSNHSNAAGSLHTTASDYALFLKHAMNEKEFIELITPQKISMTKDVDAAGKVASETLQSIDWGLGLGLQESKEGNVAFHWGHGPGARTFVAINTNTKSAVVYFANSANGLAIAEQLTQPVVGNIEPCMKFLSGKYGYKNINSPGWKEYHELLAKGVAAESKADYQTALLAYQDAAKMQPEDKQLKHSVEWVKAKRDAKDIDDMQVLKEVAGQYGPLKLTAVENKLQIEVGNQKYFLTTVNANTFLDEKDKVMLQFSKDKNDNLTLNCHFPSGGQCSFVLSPLEKMLKDTFKHFKKNAEVFLKLIGESGLARLKSETPISTPEKRFIAEHKDMNEFTALTIERRIYLKAILSAEKGIEALESKVITFDDLLKMPHPHHVTALLSEQGLIALTQGLITPQDALLFGENSSQYLSELCTDNGLNFLREAKTKGPEFLKQTINEIITHSQKFNNVGVLEFALQTKTPIQEVQASIEGEKNRQSYRS